MTQTAISADDKVLGEVHSAEADFERFASTHEGDASPIFDAWSKLMDVEKKLLTLQSDDHSHTPQSVYKSSWLKDGWSVVGMVADDTIHTTEGAPYVPIKVKPAQIFKVNLAWDKDLLSRCDFYLGQPARMHVDGYKGVVKLPFASDRLHLPKHLEEMDYLLFAIVKPKTGDYRKFVFVVRPSN
jgi:hypothetical protein